MMNRICFVLICALVLGQTHVNADVTAPGDPVRGVPDDGDWPGAEAPPLAIDDDIGTKYLHFKGDFSPDVGPTGFQVTPSAGATVVTGLTFTTANDAPERDPIAFELSGSNAGIDGPYTVIATGGIVDFMQGTAWPRYTQNTTPISFNNSTAYRHYQLLITAIRNESRANSMQIAEVEFIGGSGGAKAPQVDAGENQVITWEEQGNTVVQLSPTIEDDDLKHLSYWSCPQNPEVDFLGTQTEANALAQVPGPGLYEFLLQVWNPVGQEGSDTVAVLVVESERLSGDLSGDYRVNQLDLLAFCEQWLNPPGCASQDPGCADLLDQDGVNLRDYAWFARNWRTDWNGSLQVMIDPPEAIAQGARWRLSDGPWLDDSAIVTDLGPDIYQVEFDQVADWLRPAMQTVQIQKGQMAQVQGRYSALPDSPLMITEFMASNKTKARTRAEGQDVFPDWIEICNVYPEVMGLGGWFLTDDASDPSKWPLPDLPLWPGKYLLIYASGAALGEAPDAVPYQDDNGHYHANFRLEASGGYLALVDPTGAIAHEYVSHTLDTGLQGYAPQLADVSHGIYANEQQFFTSPTPGQANQPGLSDIAGEPQFSHAQGTFTQPFFLELTAPGAGARITYTLDGSVPTEASTHYGGPISIRDTVEVQARVFETGKVPSPITARTYLALASNLQNFSSDLPIVIVDTQAQRIVYGTYKRASAVFIDTGADGRARMTGPADFAGRSGIKTRGRSTAGAPKHSYGFEIWGPDDLDRDVSLLGLPAESDWVLYAPYNYDRSLISNAFMFELSNRIGRYAVRTRFVEMYLNTNGGKVSANDYVGLYIFEEKIKRGPERVDVENLDPWDRAEPQINGGYMLKIDRADSGDRGFRTALGNPRYGDGTLCYVDPKEINITDAQSAWIRGYLDAFEEALYGDDFTDPNTGYARFIDVNSFIDHNLLNMLAMNVDALRLSTHLHKARDGKLEMGPLWDFDRSLDSTDGRDNNARSWHGTGDGTDYHHYVWWNRLFEDKDFWQRYIDRWFDLRQGVFSTAQINGLIDAMADEIGEAQARNYSKWTSARPRYGSFQGEMDHLKDWLGTRTAWVDGQFVMPPRLAPPQGYVPPNQGLRLGHTNAAGTIYYTLDGSDPRVFGPSELSEHYTLLDESAAKRVLVPSGPVNTDWRGGAEPFDDGQWNHGTAQSDRAGGVGYDENSDFQPFISYDLGQRMNGDLNPNANTSCMIRIAFDIDYTQIMQVSSFRLRMRFDDGYIAYLNGHEIARSDNAPSNPAWNSQVSTGAESTAFVDTDISLHVNKLRLGANVLAIQGFNASTSSSDFLISAVLDITKEADVAGAVTRAGDVSATAIAYTGEPIVLDGTTLVKARVLTPGNTYSPWSGLTQAHFAVDVLPAHLRVTEIMYNPAAADPALGEPDVDNDRFEFIELKNVGDTELNLSGVSLSGGIGFDFAGSDVVTLAPGSFVLVVENRDAFYARYGTDLGAIIAGEFQGRLANGGEAIDLVDAQQGAIAHIDYGDNWYAETDGSGHSLVLLEPDRLDPSAWTQPEACWPSTTVGGSPGRD